MKLKEKWKRRREKRGKPLEISCRQIFDIDRMKSSVEGKVGFFEGKLSNLSARRTKPTKPALVKGLCRSFWGVLGMKKSFLGDSLESKFNVDLMQDDCP